MSVTGRILVYGGKGALGSVIVSTFKSKNYVSLHLFSLLMLSCSYYNTRAIVFVHEMEQALAFKKGLVHSN